MIIYNKLWIFYHIESIKIITTELFKKGSRLADLHLILPNEVPQLSC